MGNSQIGSSLPVGSVLVYAGNETTMQQQESWLPCDGSPLDTETFTELFAAIGYANGGDGSNTFKVPDHQGYFLRGVDQGADRDPDVSTRTGPEWVGNPGDNPGSLQPFATGQPSTPFVLQVRHLPRSSQKVNDGGLIRNEMAKWKSGSTTIPFGGGAKETRPRNKYVYFIIKSSATTASGQEVTIPVGSVVAIPGTGTSGLGNWLLCDGRQMDSAQYQPLYQAIGICHGGNGDPYFYLPDYRGFFLRGVDGDTSNDPDAALRLHAQPKFPPGQQGAYGDNVGSLQYEDTAQASNLFVANVPHLPTSHMKVDPVSGRTNSKWEYGSQHETAPDGGGGSESRPINAYVDWYIKVS